MFPRRAWLGFACVIFALLVHRGWNGSGVPLKSPASSDSTEIQYDSPDSARRGDTTAVILNWSRLSNVVRIVSVLCQPRLDDTIAEIFIWNNSPQKIGYNTFIESKCPQEKLRLYNSPSNLYFQARFLACEQAKTPYCFIQDDDYLIWPEVILAMRSRMSQAATSPIYLSPPHEVLSSQLRAISVLPNISTSFAWLGYGTIVTRTMVIEFLSLLKRINASEDVMKMADNYFAILMNAVPEVWFDQGLELGGGQPFTAGDEGDKRNRRHIIKAARMLDSLHLDSQLYLIKRQGNQYTETIARAPCLGKICIFETSIPLLPTGITTAASKADEILGKEEAVLRVLSNQHKQDYIEHPPSHAVDGQSDTFFQSPENAKLGDWISFDLVNRPMYPLGTMNLIVDEGTKDILRASTAEVDIGQWVPIAQRPVSCEAYESDKHHLCKVVLDMNGDALRYRLRLGESLERRWRIYEIWLV